MADRLLTAREVAERLTVSTETVLRWTRRGKLPAYKLPSGAIRYREAEVDRRIAEWATPRGGVLATPSDAAQGLGYSVLATPEVEED